MTRTMQRPISVGLAFALAAALLVVTPTAARAHDSCVIPAPAATGVLGSVLAAVNVYQSFLPTNEALCEDKFADVVPKVERDWATSEDDTSGSMAIAAADANASTAATCEDGMAAGMFPCDGVNLMSHVSLAELGAVRGNDIWGWTDPETGDEYALMGTTTGTAFVNITDPYNPDVYGFLPSASTQGGSSWRDIKVYSDHAYVVSEHTDHGVQVFDLTQLRDWDGTYTTYEMTAHYTGHGSAHNININEDTGFLYSVGAGAFSGAGLPNIVTVDSGPAAGTYQAAGANWGRSPGTVPDTGAFAVVNDGSANPTQGCEPLVGFPAGAIAVADRGSCNFTVKAMNAQNAGAVAIVVVNDRAGTPTTMGGTDPLVELPGVMISQDNGAALKAGLPATGSIMANPDVIQCGTGLHMIDINDPDDPTYAGCFQDHGYVHDTQCVVYDGPEADLRGRELCFNSNATTSGAGGLHRVAVVDVTDKANPVALSREGYPNDGYSHQGWLTEDQRFFLHGDELDEQRRDIPTTTRLWNVEDPANPTLVETFQGYGTPSIDHNVYTNGRYATASNYTTGLRVLDVGKVATRGLSQAGFFDIYPENDNPTFEGGTWSNYPWYAKEGVVAVSSIDRGLFILDITGSQVGSLRGDLDELVDAAGIHLGLETKIRRALDMFEDWIQNPRQRGPALSHLDRAIHLLYWQADVIERTGRTNLGDPAGLRALADAFQEFRDTYDD